MFEVREMGFPVLFNSHTVEVPGDRSLVFGDNIPLG